MSLDPKLEPAAAVALSILSSGNVLTKPALRDAFGKIGNTDAGDVIREAKARARLLNAGGAPETLSLSSASLRAVDDPEEAAITATTRRVLADVRAKEQRRTDILLLAERNSTQEARADADGLRQQLIGRDDIIAKMRKDLRAMHRRAVDAERQTKAAHQALELTKREVATAKIDANMAAAMLALAARWDIAVEPRVTQVGVAEAAQ